MGYKPTDACLQKAEDTEPIFVLLGRDPLAPDLVREWAKRAKKVGHQEDKIQQALDHANVMDAWAKKTPGGEDWSAGKDMSSAQVRT